MGAISKTLRRALDSLREPSIRAVGTIDARWSAVGWLLGAEVIISAPAEVGIVEAFERKQRSNSEFATEATKLGEVIIAYVDNKGLIEGNFDAVRQALRDYATTEMGGIRNADDWPNTGKSFGDQLRRLIPPMRRIGIEIKVLKRNKNGTRCMISRIPKGRS